MYSCYLDGQLHYRPESSQFSGAEPVRRLGLRSLWLTLVRRMQ